MGIFIPYIDPKILDVIENSEYLEKQLRLLNDISTKFLLAYSALEDLEDQMDSLYDLNSLASLKKANELKSGKFITLKRKKLNLEKVLRETRKIFFYNSINFLYSGKTIKDIDLGDARTWEGLKFNIMISIIICYARDIGVYLCDEAFFTKPCNIVDQEGIVAYHFHYRCYRIELKIYLTKKEIKIFSWTGGYDSAQYKIINFS